MASGTSAWCGSWSELICAPKPTWWNSRNRRIPPRAASAAPRPGTPPPANTRNETASPRTSPTPATPRAPRSARPQPRRATAAVSAASGTTPCAAPGERESRITVIVGRDAPVVALMRRHGPCALPRSDPERLRCPLTNLPPPGVALRRAAASEGRSGETRGRETNSGRRDGGPGREHRRGRGDRRGWRWLRPPRIRLEEGDRRRPHRQLDRRGGGAQRGRGRAARPRAPQRPEGRGRHRRDRQGQVGLGGHPAVPRDPAARSPRGRGVHGIRAQRGRPLGARRRGGRTVPDVVGDRRPADHVHGPRPLPLCRRREDPPVPRARRTVARGVRDVGDRKSTRLNSSHGSISYAVFCLIKKKQTHKFASVTSRIYNEGYAIGIHTFTHPDIINL